MPQDYAARVRELFELTPTEPDTYRTVPRRRAGSGPPGWARVGPPRLFGGQVASQALCAAWRTVKADHGVNSLHAYFLRPGRYDEPVDYVVDRIRDGTSFTTRRVVAVQGGDAILNLDASFHREEPGDVHQPDNPLSFAGAPEDGVEPDDPPWMRGRPLEARAVPGAPPGVSMRWVRVPARLPDDPMLHAAMLAFLSDMGPVGVVAQSLGVPRERRMMASLDHCMWFHHPARADEWLLYVLEPVAGAWARGVARGSLWTRDGRLAVSLVQEVLARRRR